MIMIGQIEYNFVEYLNGLKSSAHKPNFILHGFKAMKGLDVYIKYI